MRHIHSHSILVGAAILLIGAACDPGGSDDSGATGGTTGDPAAEDTGDDGGSTGDDDDDGQEGDDDDDGESDGGPDDPDEGDPLEVDCTSDEHDEEDICAPNKWLDEEDAFGKGPNLAPLPGFAKGINGGFIDEESMTLYVGVAYGFDTTSSITKGRKGVVMGIDLDTGDRTLIAGELLYDEGDPRNESRGTHTLVNGAPGELGHVMSLHPGDDGMLYALTSPTALDRARIVQIDPDTGDSVELWDNDADDSVQCPFSPEDDRRIRAAPWSMELADDGGFYLSFSNNPLASGLGIMKIAADASTCEIVMRATDEEELPSMGTFLDNPECGDEGPWCPTSGPFRALTLHDGMLWGTLSATGAVYRIDPASGDHERLIGTNAPAAGEGEAGVKSIAFDHEDDNALWTIGGHASTSMPILVLRDVGVAEERPAEGALRFGSEGPIWRHPTRPLLIVADEVSVVQCETPLASANCNNFSR